MNFVCALFAVHHKPRYGPVFTEKREETEREAKKKFPVKITRNAAAAAHSI